MRSDRLHSGSDDCTHSGLVKFEGFMGVGHRDGPLRALLSDERPERAAGGELHSLRRKAATSGRCRNNDPGRDQRRPAVDLWGHRREAGNGSAVFADSDLLTRFDPIEITAQLVLQLANADGHGNTTCSSTRANIAAQSVNGALRDCRPFGMGVLVCGADHWSL